MKRLNLFSNLWSSSGNSQSSNVDGRLTVGSHWLKVAVCTLFTLVGLNITQVRADDITLTITVSSFGSGTTSSYAELNWSEDASDGTTISGKGKVIKDASAIRFKSSYIYNTVALPGAIKSIEVTKSSGTSRSITPYIHTSSMASGTSGATALTAATHPHTWEMTAAQITADNRYFRLNMTTNSAYYVRSIIITCEGASCSASPTVGTVSANGPFLRTGCF